MLSFFMVFPDLYIGFVIITLYSEDHQPIVWNTPNIYLLHVLHKFLRFKLNDCFSEIHVSERFRFLGDLSLEQFF